MQLIRDRGRVEAQPGVQRQLMCSSFPNSLLQIVHSYSL